jgi:hypothetical protein
VRWNIVLARTDDLENPAKPQGVMNFGRKDSSFSEEKEAKKL